MALRHLLASVLLLAAPIHAQTDNGDECSCFRTNGSSAAYFTFHRFHDFRNIPSTDDQVPPLIQNASDTAAAPATGAYLASDVFAVDWQTQKWNNSDSLGKGGGSDATNFMINSANNVYIEKSQDGSPEYDTYLTLRTARQAFGQSVAEIDSSEGNFQHLSARFLARVTGSPGACAGMFTYLANDADPQKVQEADIEILTGGPRNVVQYTNQPSNDREGNAQAQATVNSTNPTGKDWSQWHVYRLDWTPGRSTWYLDDASVADISFQAPRDPASLVVNMWSDGGSWTGNMTMFDQAYLQIQWIQVAFNTSGPFAGATGNAKRDGLGARGGLEKRKGGKGCKVVCGLDENVEVTGTPALLYNSTGIPMGGEGGVTAWRWVVLVVVGLVGFGLV